jgi:galactokinase
MIKIKAPGRICLFGEHQDYLNYPVISMAISKYIYLEAERILEQKFIIDMPDINEYVEISLSSKHLEYESKRDYLKSGYNHFIRRGILFDKGYKIKITGDIPIGAGASSSSALVLAWLSFLNLISNAHLNQEQLAIEGYNAEVKEFNEAGGMMDHYTSVFGNILYLEPKEFHPQFSLIDTKLHGFILGDSLQKKDTVYDLMKVKNTALKAFKILREVYPNFDKFKSSLEEIKAYLPNLKKEYRNIIKGNIINRDITQQAKNLIFQNLNLLQKKDVNSHNLLNFYNELGNLLIKHHSQLDQNIGISTKKINDMLKRCFKSGALGGKINGSGFGGTMFVMCLENEDKIIETIENAGGIGYKIQTSNGVEISY